MKRLWLLLLLPTACGQVYLRTPAQPAAADLPAGWTETLIDGGVRTINSSSLIYTADGRWTITHNGGEAWSTADHFRTAYYTRTGDITVTARIVSQNSGTSTQPETGLMLRDSTAANSANTRVSVVAPITGAERHIKQRGTGGGSTATILADPGSVSIPQCLRVEVDASLNSWRAFYSQGCSSYTQFDAGTASYLSGEYHVALLSTPSDFADAGVTETSVFDSVVVSETATDHSSPQEAGFVPTSYPVNEDGGTVTVTVERIGDGTGACSLNYVVNDGTAVAGTDYTDESGSFSWGDGVTGKLTESISVLDRADNNGSRNFTVVVSKDSCANDTLVDATATVTINDTDSGTTLTWEPQDSAGCPGGRSTYYPGMRGFAACTRGGFVPGTTVHFITTTTMSGPGSIVEYAAASCPKVGVFTTSGEFDYGGAISTGNDCDGQSLVGETSPSHVVLRDVMVRQRGSNSVISHVTIGAGDASGWTADRDPIQFGHNNNDDVVLANVTLQWSVDENLHCYPGQDSERLSVWQSLILNPLHGNALAPDNDGKGAISNEDCIDMDFNRTVFMNAAARNPFLRSPTGAVINTVVYNSGYQTIRLINLNEQHQQSGTLVPTFTNIINNLWIEGPNTNTGIDPVLVRNAWNSASRVYLSGNSATWVDCSTQSDCVDESVTGNPISGSELASAMPAGVVEETFTIGNSTSEQAFLAQIVNHAGARPNDRLAVTQSNLDDIDYASNADGGFITDVSDDYGGGWPSVTEVTVDHTDPNSTHCGGAIPQGAAQDVIKNSGLTALHEWAISCADAVMPPGWRPDTLEDYAAP